MNTKYLARHQKLAPGPLALTVRCASCGYHANTPDAFPRAADRLRECPRCGGVDLEGLPGTFPAEARKALRLERGL